MFPSLHTQQYSVLCTVSLDFQESKISKSLVLEILQLISGLNFNSNDNSQILTQVYLKLTVDIPSILSRYMRQGERGHDSDEQGRRKNIKKTAEILDW